MAPAEPERPPGAELPPVGLRLAIYRQMVRARRVDAGLAALQRQGVIGFHGSCLGQEAVAVGAAFAIEPRDWIFPALRESAALLVRGLPLETYLAQSFGSARDPQKGRQMPSHPASRRVHQVSWSSSIGTQLPQAVGMAWAAKRAKDATIALAFLGEGATSTPDFHAALNFAGLFDAPVVFVCQNNGYAISVPASQQTRSESFAIKARAYGVRAERIDGNDALAVYERVRHAAERARNGAGPTFLECVTYRRAPHSSSDDPRRYRTEGEEDAWALRDPIARLRAHLFEVHALHSGDEAELDAQLAAEFQSALAVARADPAPALETLFDDVYARRPFHLEEQARSLATGFAGPR
jgi:pyruvate dehydrogenase E1 component alpha subunit/2-oxoisovalerate dehydrogenase E1 component alpha subunit